MAKKSFFEINQENSYSNVKKDAKSIADKEDGEIDGKADDDEQRFGETVDMNALDYEDGEENDDALGNKNKSESMAIAFGVQVKPNEIPPRNEKENDSKRKKESNLNGDDRSKVKRDDKHDNKDSQRSRHDSTRRGSRRSRSTNRRNSPARSRFDRNNRSSNYDSGRMAGRNVDRRRSRSYDRSYDRNRRRSRSRDRRYVSDPFPNV